MSEYTFSSYFKEIVLDNNKLSVSDINLGLTKLFTKYVANECNLTDDNRYLVSENEEYYPDLVALYGLGDQTAWWWFMMTNRLDDPLKDIEANYTYSIVGKNQMYNTINDTWANKIETTNYNNGRVINLDKNVTN